MSQRKEYTSSNARLPCFTDRFRREVDNRSSEDIPLMDRVSVASGMADIEEIVEDDVDSVFRLADERMYENKRLMKAERAK